MPANTLITPSVIRTKENVLDQIYNFNPSDAPLLSMIDRETIDNVYFEYQRDTYRAPNPANATIEGADATYAAQVEPTLLNNRTQIFQDTVSVSNTTERVKKYGRDREIKRLSAKKMIELKRDDEAACIANGATVTGTSGVAAKKRGLAGFITGRDFGATGAAPNPVTNTAPVAGTARPLTQAMVLNGVQNCYQNGGSAEILMCSPAHKVKNSTFTYNVQRYADVSGKAAASVNAAIDFIKTDFGVTKVVPNRVMTTAATDLNTTLYLLDPDKLALAVLRPFERAQMATIGDAENWQVRTETSLVVRDEKPLWAIGDITVTGN